MINKKKLRSYCSEDISKIENYEAAVADMTQIWHCHHKAELLPCGRYSMPVLEKYGLYYKQPADRLILLTRAEHRRLHMQGRAVSEETRRKVSAARRATKGTWRHSEETRKKISEAQKGSLNHNYGKHHSEETRKKISESVKKTKADAK